jgi:hypothetical protein
MTQDQKIIRTKVGLLELAKQLGNASQACKIMGYSSSKAAQQGPKAGWRPGQRRPHRHRSQPPPRPAMAENAFVQIRRRPDRRHLASLSAQNRFLTDIYIAFDI